MSVRVRFAPSPTGYLHIGGARSALYNWLWARQKGGSFVLRIEDTDRERSTEESVQVVFDSLRWLGLDWDEGPQVGGDHGPYFQTERTTIYHELADKLISSGHAYRCYATKEEIQAQRTEYEQTHGKKGFRFRSPWRDKTEESDKPHVVRLKAPADGVTGWDDLVKGHVEYPNTQQQDVVLVRTDGIPLYNFGCVVDDLTMSISLVARGDDHLVNTPIQILLYQALGEAIPQFAHMPMILGHDGKKMGKRHGSVSVLEYRDQGFLPDAVLNYLARLGWSHGDQEVFSRAELIEKFDWSSVGTSGAKYDTKKFEFVQAEHLRALPDAELATKVVPFLAERGLTVAADDRRLLGAIPHIKPRATTFVDVADQVDYFFRDELEYEDKGRRKFLKPEHAARLKKLAKLLDTVEPFEIDALTSKIAEWMEAEGLTMKDFAQSTRVALTGRTRSPGLYELMEILGRDVTLARLATAIRVTESTES